MSDNHPPSRRAVLAGAGIASLVALFELIDRPPEARAATAYNLPFTDLNEPGAAIPTYDWRDGWHTRPNNGHHGIDFTNLDGQGLIAGRKIYPIYPGTVNGSYYDDDLGHVVSVLQNDGRQTRYCHLQSRSVSQGASVNASSVLGRLGDTGDQSFGNHLHLELRPSPGAHDIDPWPFLKDALHANGVASSPPSIPIYLEDPMKLYRIVNPQGGLNGVAVLLYSTGFAVYESAYWRDRLAGRYKLALEDISQDDFTDECNRLSIPFSKVAQKATTGGGSWSWSQEIADRISAL